MAKRHNNRGFGEDVWRMMRKARLAKLKLDADFDGEVRKLFYG